MMADDERQSVCLCVSSGLHLLFRDSNVLHNDDHAHAACWLLCDDVTSAGKIPFLHFCSARGAGDGSLCTSDVKTGFTLTES